MIKLMIADDEASIRSGLKRYIDWGAWDIQLVAEAGNGLEALQKALDIRPDILLTDIRMPQLDGVELSRQLREKLPRLRIIMLTGYNETQYLKAALEIGVKAYLLKPAGTEEIIEAVLKQKNEILGEQEKRQQEQSRDTLLEESLPILQMHFINDLLSGKFSLEDAVRRKAETLKIKAAGPLYRVLLLDLNYQEPYELRSRYEQDIDRWHMLQALEQLGEEFPEGLFYCETEPQSVFLLLNASEEKQMQAYSLLLSEKLMEAVGQTPECKPLLGVGKTVGQMTLLNQAYDSALKALYRSVWYEEKRVFFYSDGQQEAFDRQPAEGLGCEKQILLHLAAARYAEARQMLGQMFEIYRASFANFDFVREACKRIILFVPGTGEKPAEEYSRLCQLIDTISPAKALEEWMDEKLGGQGQPLPSRSHGNLIRKTIDYMKAHYSEDINLQILAKEVFMSPSYLGRIFREETGMKINDWLGRYRIEKAKELLRTTDIKTYEIAEKVGFSSYKYFSVYFLKYAGCSARDYRSRTCMGEPEL